MRGKKLLLIIISTLFLVAVPLIAYASHTWGNYRWANSGNGITLDVGNNMTGASWNQAFNRAMSEWNKSSVLTLNTIGGSGACDPISGQVEVCNADYGDTGWLGIAQIWTGRGPYRETIAAGVAKMNDFYFNQPQYNTQAWRDFVVCQEIGHDFGLGHQDEAFDNPNLGSCMDYTRDPDGTINNQVSNEVPNQHDYELLVEMYGSSGSGGDGGGDTGCNPKSPKCNGSVGNSNVNYNSAAEWGQLVRSEGRIAVFERVLSDGGRLVTFVVWAN